MSQKAIYYNVSNGGFAEHGAASPTIKVLQYLKGITESVSESETDQYANGELVGSIKGVTKITGEIRTTARDPELEAMAALEISTDAGVARTIGRKGKRMDVHYAYNEVDDNGVETAVKVWMLNVEIGKPTRTHETKTNSATLGEYAYPYTCYGVKLKAATGNDDYVDEKGLPVIIHDVEARPDDTGYATFFASVPAPKYKAPTGKNVSGS